ncbi:polysaccharide lyase 6 family protein [Mariniblastus sp.]|nr:polysaccharide lyase 6 family protein [Mariniblastus sp.]
MKSVRIKTRTAICSALLVFAAVVPVNAEDFPVSSADDIETAMETAGPGDTLVMTDGTWTNQEIVFAGVGTAGSPITLRPQTPGGVVLTGVSQLLISGDYLVVDGIHFRDGTIENSDHVVQFRGSLGEATNCRFTNSVIESYSGPDLNDKYHYVSLYGQNNRVDHCSFLDQQNIGPQMVAWLDESADPISAFHTIDSNHFGDRPQGFANGFEGIRLGDSDTSGVDAHILVENNLFERVDGEIEIISSKSNFNIFRFNTFRESKGTLTLRHGNGNIVEGNFFLGEGTEDSGGIRVVGENHIIINNYIADVDDEADGAISFAAGVPNTPLNGYLQVRDTIVAHNTIVNVAGAGITFDWGRGSSNRSLLPVDLTITGNLIADTGDSLFEGAEGAGYSFENNIAFGAALGISSRPGILEVDPLLMLNIDGLFRPDSSSPAINGADGSALLTVDMDGQARDGMYDIGADEASIIPIIRRPLTTDDVGAPWFNYVPPAVWPLPIQPPPGAFVVIEAENFSTVTDPDNDGDVWTVASVSDASGGQVIKAPDGSRTNLPGVHETLAIYNVTFSEAGDYRVYYLARGFDGSSDSFYVPDSFSVDPESTENISSNGAFRWENGDEFSVSESQVGQPLELRLGRREGDVEIDAIVFHVNGSLTDPQLDLFLAGSTPSILGDWDEDGDVDADDINYYSGNLGEDAVGDLAVLDLNGDGEITLADHDLHVTTLAQTSNEETGALIGDINLDGTVDVLGDAFILVANLGTSGSDLYQRGDLNADQQVNVLGDAFRLVSSLGQSND